MFRKCKEKWQSLTIKQRQWLWFFGLWISGLLAVTMLSYVIRFMMFGEF